MGCISIPSIIYGGAIKTMRVIPMLSMGVVVTRERVHLWEGE